jgi:L-ectoine synthase
MRVEHLDALPCERVTECPDGAFASSRFLLDRDGMGFGLHHTRIQAGGPYNWHYKNHQEACYCVSGEGILTDTGSGESWEISPGSLYILDDFKAHSFLAFTEVVLISVFNPPCVGGEVHQGDGSYPAKKEVFA